jgi:hypothetical protein
MGEVRHTPGSWAVHPSKARVDAFVGGAPLPVCELLWPTDQRSEAETEANAHLIAAAPEMYEALKEANEALHRSDVMNLALDPIYRTRIMKAIAKAEGRA